MWVRRNDNQIISHTEKAKGGAGVLDSVEIQTRDTFIRADIIGYKKNTLNPGSSLGYHQHRGSSETIYILAGEADYTDNNGKKYVLEAGDSTYCGDGESHSIACHGDRPLEFMALILKEEK